MPETLSAPPADHALAAELAVQAGRLLVELRRRSTAAGMDPKAMKDAGDADSNKLLLAALEPNVAAGDRVLSEEAKDDLSRLDARRVWIVDPLDGTREFGETPRTDWAVHVALCIDGAPVCGAVALPALDEVFATGGTTVLPDAVDGPPRVVVSRTRPPAAATFLAEQIGGVLVEMGSAGAKAMAILRGEVDVYAHSGGQYEWDSCAPVAVALGAGLHASRIDGSPLVYNNADPYLPDLLICRPELAEASLAALAAFDG